MNKLILSLTVLGLGTSVNCYGFHSENLNLMSDNHNETPLWTSNNQIVIHTKWTDKSKHMVNFKEISPRKYLKLRLQLTHPCLMNAMDTILSVSKLAIVSTGIGMVLYHNNTDFRNEVQYYSKYLSQINSDYIKPYSKKVQDYGKYLSQINGNYIKPYSEKVQDYGKYLFQVSNDYIRLHPKTSVAICGVILFYCGSQKFRNVTRRVLDACFNPALRRIKSFKKRSVNRVRAHSNSALRRVRNFSDKSFNYVYDKVCKCFSVTFNSVKFLF